MFDTNFAYSVSVWYDLNELGEGGGGFNFCPFPTRGIWINVEAMGIDDSPYGSVLYVYSAGQSGFLLQSQLLLRF